MRASGRACSERLFYTNVMRQVAERRPSKSKLFGYKPWRETARLRLEILALAAMFAIHEFFEFDDNFLVHPQFQEWSTPLVA